MPISVLCGACSAKLNAPDAAAGKKVKCPKCGSPLVIPVPSNDFEVVEDEPAPKPTTAKAKPKPVLLEEDDEDNAPPPKKAGKKPVVVDDEEEVEDAPKPKKKKSKGKTKKAAGNNLPFLIGGGVLGLALVGFLVYWFVLREPQVAKAPDTKPPGDSGVRPGPQPSGPGPVGPGPGEPVKPQFNPKLVTTELNKYGLAITMDLPEGRNVLSPVDQWGRRQVVIDFGGLMNIVLVAGLGKDEWKRSWSDQLLKGHTTISEDDTSHFCELPDTQTGPSAKKFGIFKQIQTPNGPVGIRYIDTLVGHSREQIDVVRACMDTAKANDKSVAPPPPPVFVSTNLSSLGVPVMIDLPATHGLQKRVDMPDWREFELHVERLFSATMIVVNTRQHNGNLIKGLDRVPGWKKLDGEGDSFLWELPAKDGKKAKYGAFTTVKFSGGTAWLHQPEAELTREQADLVWKCMKSAKAISTPEGPTGAPQLAPKDLGKYGVPVTIDLPPNHQITQPFVPGKGFQPTKDVAAKLQLVPDNSTTEIDVLIVNDSNIWKESLDRWPGWKVVEGGKEDFLWEAPGRNGKKHYGAILTLTTPTGKYWLQLKGAEITREQADLVWKCMKSAKAN
jgi:DNA-directed RNA polymerase subunit RPC12/RpoP